MISWRPATRNLRGITSNIAHFGAVLRLVSILTDSTSGTGGRSVISCQITYKAVIWVEFGPLPSQNCVETREILYRPYGYHISSFTRTQTFRARRVFKFEEMSGFLTMCISKSFQYLVALKCKNSTTFTGIHNCNTELHTRQYPGLGFNGMKGFMSNKTTDFILHLKSYFVVIKQC
jgi:hypothetical protein